MAFAHEDQDGRQRTRLLLVEDDADTRDMLARLLARDYAVETAGCYDSAFAAATDNVPDVVITDVGLPGRDGITLMRDLRERFGVCGIAVTGHAIDDPAKIRAAGFSKYLMKPIRFEDLLRAVATCCDQNEAALARSSS